MTSTIKAVGNTAFKSTTAQLSETPNAVKHPVKAGEEFTIQTSKDLPGQHVLIRFDSVVGDRQEWIAFKPHFSGWATNSTPASPQSSGSSSGTPKRFKPQEFRPNSIAAKFIGHFEGLELKQYYCSAGVSTIGLGTTRWFDGSPIPVGATITKEQAIELFKRDAGEFIAEIQRLVDVPLTARQIAAVISFCYNCGSQGFEESSLLKSINSGAPLAEIRANFRKWSKANGEVLPGLLRRRNAEAMLWENRDDWDTAGYD